MGRGEGGERKEKRGMRDREVKLVTVVIDSHAVVVRLLRQMLFGVLLHLLDERLGGEEQLSVCGQERGWIVDGFGIF